MNLYRLEARYLDRVYLVVAVLGTLLAAAQLGFEARRLPESSIIVVAAFFAAIAVGESLHVSLLGVRELPFVAIAASLAFAMTGEAPAGHLTTYDASVVTVTTALALLVG
jgi:hypothetical protein